MSFFAVTIQPTAAWRFLQGCLAPVCCSGLAVGVVLGVLPGAVLAANSDVELKVGIVQRFGEKPTDQITLQALAGDRLTLRFQSGNQSQTLVANSIKLDVQMQSLPEPEVLERVVLSTHRSFESAEDNANQWRAQGIEVEIAQPNRWQVWAKRSVYNTPLLRRLLLQSLQTKGVQAVYLESKVIAQLPRASWVVNGYRYTRDALDVSAGKGMVRVRESKEGSDRVYGGKFRLQPNTYKTYTLVNQVPLEVYLRGVVPHEIGLAAPTSAIAAQAVLARTYALRNLRRFGVDEYELCADTQCQVYWGLSGAAAKTDQAIAATQGQVLTYQNELVDAVYSSTTGGVTAPFHDVWNGWERPYLRAVVDSVSNVWDLQRSPLADEKNFRAFIKQRKGFNEEGWEMFRWQVKSSLPELNQDLRNYLQKNKSPLADFKTIQQMWVSERSPAGRVQKLTVKTDRGVVELQKDNILIAFYAPNSTLFYLDGLYGAGKVLQGYAFVGGGFGHGVGLSQTGSYRLGQLGWSYDRILSFYYPGTQLQPISSRLTFWRDRFSLPPAPGKPGDFPK
jgi:SpoIID/LytB domain protein